MLKIILPAKSSSGFSHQKKCLFVLWACPSEGGGLLSPAHYGEGKTEAWLRSPPEALHPDPHPELPPALPLPLPAHREGAHVPGHPIKARSFGAGPWGDRCGTGSASRLPDGTGGSPAPKPPSGATSQGQGRVGRGPSGRCPQPPAADPTEGWEAKLGLREQLPNPPCTSQGDTSLASRETPGLHEAREDLGLPRGF